ncbi:MAG: hypothetical protein ABI432_19325 [Flavobacteriales bacterium]
MSAYEILDLVIAAAALVWSGANHVRISNLKKQRLQSTGSILSGTFTGNQGGAGSFGGQTFRQE